MTAAGSPGVSLSKAKITTETTSRTGTVARKRRSRKRSKRSLHFDVPRGEEVATQQTLDVLADSGGVAHLAEGAVRADPHPAPPTLPGGGLAGGAGLGPSQSVPKPFTAPVA